MGNLLEALARVIFLLGKGPVGILLAIIVLIGLGPIGWIILVLGGIIFFMSKK